MGTRSNPYADAYKEAFDARFPQPYAWVAGDFVQLAKWRTGYPKVTPEQFVAVARAMWDAGETYSSVTIRGLCSRWAQLSLKVPTEPPGTFIARDPTDEDMAAWRGEDD